MVVIVASRFDADAQALAAGWPGAAGVLTPVDLSMEGWRHVTGGDGNTAVIGGRMVAASEIDGVLTRLPAVLERELGSIAAGDRPYVAAEITAWSPLAVGSALPGAQPPVTGSPDRTRVVARAVAARSQAARHPCRQ